MNHLGKNKQKKGNPISMACLWRYDWEKHKPYGPGRQVTIRALQGSVVITEKMFNNVFGYVAQMVPASGLSRAIYDYIEESEEDEWVTFPVGDIRSRLKSITWNDLNWDFVNMYAQISVADQKPSTEEELAESMKMIEALIALLSEASEFDLMTEYTG